MATEKSGKIAVFAGTLEGHELARHGAEKSYLEKIDFYVATEYGSDILADVAGVNVTTGRIDKNQMVSMFRCAGYQMIIDATHPYASQVTENIKAGAAETGIRYIRLLRKEETPASDRVITVDDIEGALKVLDLSDERFLLTTGSKDIGEFAKVRDFSERAVARVLPGRVSLDACIEAGMKPANIICMQGPFTREMNLATMVQFDLGTLVTKSTGRAGGFAEKTGLAKDGYKIIVIGRPCSEEGLSLTEVEERLDEFYG